MTEPAKSRGNLVLRRLGRVFFWGLVILLVLGLVKWWWLESDARQGREDLARALVDAEALGPRWKWEEIEADRPVVPEERNSSRILDRLLPLLKDRIDPTKENRDTFRIEVAANELLDDDDLVLLDQVTSGREEAIALAVSLRDYPEGRIALQLAPDFVSTQMPHLPTIRAAAWLLDLDAERQLHQGRGCAAADNIHATLHAGAAVRGEGIIVSQLTRMSVRKIAATRVERLLAMSEPDEVTLVGLQKHLTNELAEHLVRVGLRGERGAIHQFFEGLAGPDSPLASVLDNFGGPLRRDPGTLAKINAWLYSYHLPGEHAEYLRWVNRAVAIAELPRDQQLPEWAAYENDLKTSGVQLRAHGGAFSCRFIPNASKFAEAGLRERAHLACAVAALAAERFRRAHQRWPATLDELVPGYLPEIPADPYTGRPLLSKQVPDGLAIYSVGRNGVDDGGALLAEKDVLQPNADLGLRLWNPPQRRLPPSLPGGEGAPVAPPPPEPF
jgi:hypothetical protein